MATGAVPMRDLPDGPGDCRGLAWNESPSATPDLLPTFGGTAAAASPMVSSLFHPCRRPTAKELFAFCCVDLMLSASLWPCGVLRRGALDTATVQPNRQPALPCPALPAPRILREGSHRPTRTPADQCKPVALSRTMGR